MNQLPNAPFFQVTRIVFSSVTRRRKAARPLLIKRTIVPLGCSWIRDVPQKFTSRRLVLKLRPFRQACSFLTDLHQHKLPREGNGSSSLRSLQIASSSTNKLLNYFPFNGKGKGNVATSWTKRMLRALLGMVIVHIEECNSLVQLRG